jgi:spermidine synthase
MSFWISLLFFLSGFSALIYEVAWTRLLGLVFGNSGQATSCVLAAFLGGLAAGAYLGGRLSDRLKSKHLLAYGIAELATAAVSPVVTAILFAYPGLLGAFHMSESEPARTAVRLLLGGLPLLVPTMLMGSTLPLLIRFLSDITKRPAHFFDQLYTVNTFGAAIGALAASFVGFAYLGISATVWAAASLSAVAGSTACIIATKWQTKAGSLPVAGEPSASGSNGPSRETGEPSASGSNGPSRETGEPSASTGPIVSAGEPSAYGLDRTQSLLAGLAFALGFSSLGYEVLWTRLIRNYIAPDTYAFTFCVVTFLLGLTFGAIICDRFIIKPGLPVKQQLATFAIVQYAAAIACAAVLIFAPLAILIRQAIEPTVFTFFAGGVMAPLVSQLVVTSIYFILPATIIGICFPMVGALAAAHTASAKVGGAVGITYGANTVGCVLGALLTGIGLIPFLGTYTSSQLAISLTVATATVALLMSSCPRAKAILVIAPAVVLLGLLLCTRSPYLDYMQHQTGERRLAHFAEDANSMIFVFTGPDYVQLVINGQPYANTVLTGRRYMRMLGHLPMLLHKDPQDVLNICFGTGTTAGSIICHDSVRQLDVVDLSPAVLASAPFFKATNSDVAANPKCKLIVGDGRNFLLTTGRSYDVITFEPPPPLEAGVVNLYSTDFYRLAKAHLKPGGIMCQWVPMNQECALLWKMMLASAAAVFPHISIWEPNTGQAILIASNDPLPIQIDQLAKRIEGAPRVKQSLAEVSLARPSEILSTLLMGNRQVRDLTNGLPEITDDHPRLEYFIPYSGRPLSAAEVEPSAEAINALLSQDSKQPESAQFSTDFDRQVKALSFLRKADQASDAAQDPRRAHELAAKAAQTCPDNTFYSFVADKIYSAPKPGKL